MNDSYTQCLALGTAGRCIRVLFAILKRGQIFADIVFDVRPPKETMASTTVLVVEDSKLFRVEKEHVLKNAGYLVLSAADGMEALKVARESLPDLILLDMMLPGIDGTLVLRTLKADPATAQIPVVVVSSLSQKNEERLLSDGAVAFLEKNELLTSDSLLYAIGKALAGSAV
jgi:CheY-like chemotaxis protein